MVHDEHDSTEPAKHKIHSQNTMKLDRDLDIHKMYLHTEKKLLGQVNQKLSWTKIYENSSQGQR